MEEKKAFTADYDAFDNKPQEKRFGKWIAYASGSLYHEDNFFIPEAKVLEDTLIIHMMTFDWIDFNTFIPAYLQACKNAGKKKITARTYF